MTQMVLVRSDMTGRVALGGQYRNREFSMYRDSRGVIRLTPLPVHDPEEDDSGNTPDPAAAR